MRGIAAAVVLGAAMLLAEGCGGGATTHATTQASTPATQTSTQTLTTAPAGPPIAEVLGPSGAPAATITGDGSLSAATADGHGGWFIAGSFTELDGRPAQGLAHVLAGGAIDPGWHSSLASSGRTALAASPDTLYAAGSIGDTDRSRLLALDAATGAQRRALPVPPGPISALALDGDRLFVATSTTTVASHPSCLEAIDPQSGTPVGGFTADVRLAPELGCIATMRTDGPWLYVAGAFRAVDGVPRARIARLQTGTGNLDQAWNPPAAAIPTAIYDVALAPAGVVVAGSSPALSALSTSTGAPVSGWQPPAAITTPLSLAILGQQLLVAGQLHNHNGLFLLTLPGGALQRSLHLPAGRNAELLTPSGSETLLGLLRSG